MVDFHFRPVGIIPRTVEEAEYVMGQAEVQRAQERGEWLPEGWEWVDDTHERVPRDSLGAWDREHDVVVFVIPPPWSCPYCGETDRLMGSCTTVDFMPEGARGEMLAEWRGRQRRGAVLGVHGVGAPKVVFDMVWNRWCLRERGYGWTMGHPEKDKLIRSIRAGEEFSRRTGRTSRMVEEAVKFVFDVGERVVLVGTSKDAVKRMVEMAHVKIEERAGSSREADQLKGMVTGCTHEARKSIEGLPGQLFEDHEVWRVRAERAIEEL